MSELRPRSLQRRPGTVARAAQSLRLRAADLADLARGRRDPLVPPRRLSGYVGGGDFRATGDEFLGHFRALAALRPEDRVLEIGCGVGRMARALVPVLRPPGSYDGFDVVRPGIDWCRARYRDTPAPFRFEHADLRNSEYNPGGAIDAAGYRFPYRDTSFDLALATSVFTHLLPDGADHYLAEAARTLAGGGRLFATWLLFGGRRVTSPPPPFHRPAAGSPAAVSDPLFPEAAVAYDEGWVRERLEAHGFERIAIHAGSWAAGEGRTGQDIVIAYRG